MIYSLGIVKGQTEVFSNKGVTSLLILSIEKKYIMICSSSIVKG